MIRRAFEVAVATLVCLGVLATAVRFPFPCRAAVPYPATNSRASVRAADERADGTPQLGRER